MKKIICIALLFQVLTARAQQDFLLWQNEYNKLADADWLIKPTSQKAAIYKSADGKDIILFNGLLKRAFRISPNVVCADFTNMSNGQIISLQLRHFQFEMDNALVNHLRKITFIHGVGEGVLRSAIREELKKYPNIKFEDAPVEKFGYGATEVVFN